MALFFVVGISYMQAAFTYPPGNPPGNNVPAPINLSSTYQNKVGALEVGVLGVSGSGTVGVTDGFILNGVMRTAAQGWPSGWSTGAPLSTCHLEVRRVDTTAKRLFPHPNATPVIYPTCDDYLTREARLAGWITSGGDNCTTVNNSDCINGLTPSACVYTRMVCTGAITMVPSIHATSTYGGGSLSVPNVQCNDGRNNDANYVKIPDPTGGLPTAGATAVAFSPNGLHLVVAYDVSPFLKVYSRPSLISDVFTKVADPVAPPGTPWSIAFAPDGKYFTIMHEVAPFVTSYRRTLVTDNTFTKIMDPTAGDPPPTGYGGAHYSPDGLYLAIAHSGIPYISIYKRTLVSDNTFTKIPDPTGGFPPNPPSEVKFSPDGLYLAITHISGDQITIYKRPLISSDAFSKITSPVDIPSNGNGLDFSPDGLYLAVAHNSAPFVTLFKRTLITSDTFTKISDPNILPTSAVGHVDFSPDGLRLAVTYADSLLVYSRPSITSDVFTSLGPPNEVPEGNDRGLHFSTDGGHVATVTHTSPYIYIYRPQVPGDAETDFPADAHCGSIYDTTEGSIQACSDGISNDLDGLTDYPADIQCENAWDTSE